MATEERETFQASGAKIHRRLQDLDTRRRQLVESRPAQQGDGSDGRAETLARAQQRAREAAQQTARAYERAAQAHDRAADVLERLALDRVGDQEQRQASAKRHRQLAELDRGRAEDEWGRLGLEAEPAADGPTDPASPTADQPS